MKTGPFHNNRQRSRPLMVAAKHWCENGGELVTLVREVLDTYTPGNGRCDIPAGSRRYLKHSARNASSASMLRRSWR